MTAAKKVAEILRIKEEALVQVCNDMNELCGSRGVLERVVAENDFKIKEILSLLGLKKNAKSGEIYKAIISKLKRDDRELFKILGKPKCTSQKTCGILLETVKDLSGVGAGFFLKGKKATEMLRKCPPPNMLKALNYKNVDELLQKEDLKEVFSALRFIESSDWMNNEFIHAFNGLSSDDFEEREIKIIVLSGKWLDVAEKFIKKKYHNVSHLKELGIIFIIPLEVDAPGEMLRIFTLLLHYLHEVKFYSKLFRKYESSEYIGEKIISLLRGDVLEGELPDGSKNKWRIVQRYLAKEDENDPRLFEPHVNPETIHWDKAENNFTQLDAKYPHLEFTFWKDLNFVGDFFENKTGRELVSFNLIDSIMSLVKEKEMIKYLYHHQEALWNRIFVEYIGKGKMEDLILDNFEKGYIDLEKSL
jgi:hypothetical protein